MWILQVLSYKRSSKKKVRIGSLVMAATVALSTPLTVRADTYEQQIQAQQAMTIDSNHAIGLHSDRGTDLLIHIGLDTVSLGGKHFNRVVKENDKVKKGDLLIEFDKEAVMAAGFDVITPVIICNTDDFKEVIRYTGKEVEVGDTVMELVK